MSNYLSAPNAVIWDVTSRCNLQCRHCYVEADAQRTEEPSTEKAIVIIDQLRKAKVFRLSFSGGEPLLRNDLYELLQYASRFFPVEVATNGLLLTEEAAHKLKAARVSVVQMSMDGLEKTHDYLRGRKGAFNKLIKATEILKKVGIPFGVTTVIYKKNASQNLPGNCVNVVIPPQVTRVMIDQRLVYRFVESGNNPPVYQVGD